MLGRPGCLYEKQKTCNLFTVTRFFCVTPGKGVGGGGNYINPKQINVWQPLKGCGKWLEIEPSLQSPNLKLWWFLLDSQTENTDLISNWSWTIDCMTGPHCFSLSSHHLSSLSSSPSRSLSPFLFFLFFFISCSLVLIFISKLSFLFFQNIWKEQMIENSTN